jgi:hypothetical protein
MKNLCAPELSRWWTPHPLAEANAPEVRPWGGAFQIPFQERNGLLTRNVDLRVIASRGDPNGREETERWDHVSVSTATRCPTWEEMEFIKRLFFERDETAMQLHVPARDHINNHPYCLHLWRPLDQPIPRPPAIMVGDPILRTMKG